MEIGDCCAIVTLVETWRMCDDDDFVSCRDLVDENQWMRGAKFYVNQQKERRGSNMTRCSNRLGDILPQGHFAPRTKCPKTKCPKDILPQDILPQIAQTF